MDHPFFDKIEYSLSNGPVDNGEQPASPNSGWRTSRNEFKIFKTSGYYDFLEMGNEIKALIDGSLRLLRILRRRDIRLRKSVKA